MHRCVGNRLAERQLTILWKEILKRFLIHGITEMKVRIPA